MLACHAASGSLPNARAAPAFQHRHRHRLQQRGLVLRAATNGQVLLDTYWQARGVFDASQRRKLLDVAQMLRSPGQPPPQGITPLASAQPLPGVPTAWAAEDKGLPEVLEVSRRLLQLHQLLGGGQPAEAGSSMQGSGSHGVSASEVVWMVTREPGLLTADFRRVTRRLLEMKVAVAGTNVDVLRVVVRQPALLLSDTWALDLAALQPRQAATAASSSAAGAESGPQNSLQGHTDPGSSGQADPVTEMLLAWEHGLSNDGMQEWGHRFHQLLQYIEEHGDTAVGYRDGDDPELARWAGKQRSEYRRGQLHPTRRQCLVDAGFEFDADQVEWMRWYKELEKHMAQGSATPLTMGVDLYLINWCSVQRIARRSRVLSEQRVQALDRIGFDWSGADPLS